MSGLGNINDFIEENNHGGLIEENADFYSTTEMPIEENVIVKKVKQPKVWDWKKSIGRALMSGYHTDYILNKYGLLINQSPNKEKILKYLRVNDGLLGYLFVDTSLFDEKFDYSNIPNGMKKYNLYAIHSKNFEKTVSKTVVKNSNGTMDGFLNGNDIIVKTYSCQDKYTNLPAISSIDEVDENEVRRIGKKLLDDGRIGVRDFELFKNTDKLSFLKKMFRTVTQYIPTNKKTEDDVTDFGLENQELTGDKVVLVKDISVDNNKEQFLDDVGDVSVKTVQIKDEEIPSDEEDVVFVKVASPEMDNLKETAYDDFDIKANDDLQIEDGGEVNDGTNKSFDEFDLSHKNKQDVDEGEFFASDDDSELDIDEKPEDFKISSKGSFDW